MYSMLHQRHDKTCNSSIIMCIYRSSKSIPHAKNYIFALDSHSSVSAVLKKCEFDLCGLGFII